MGRRLLSVAAAALVGLLLVAGAADATTLGITSAPGGASPGPCAGTMGAYIQTGSDPSTPFTIPAGGGAITQWQTLTASDTPGTHLTLAVVVPSGSGWTVVATDAETLPSPLPSSGVATFTPAHPIQVAAGELLAMTGDVADQCYWAGGTLPAADTLAGGAGAVSPGVTLSPSGSGASYAVNLAVALSTTEDAAVQTSAIGAPASPGAVAVLASTVTNNGPVAGSPITFSDNVPAGLTIDSAAAAQGICTIVGQNVTCTITGLGVGQSVPVDVVVTAGAPGSYTNAVSLSVGAPATDANAANNLATGTLVVGALPRRCLVPGLRGLPLAAARKVLGQLGCRVHVRSRRASLATGLVIGVAGGAGTYPYRQTVTLIVSSGRKH